MPEGHREIVTTERAFFAARIAAAVVLGMFGAVALCGAALGVRLGAIDGEGALAKAYVPAALSPVPEALRRTDPMPAVELLRASFDPLPVYGFRYDEFSYGRFGSASFAPLEPVNPEPPVTERKLPPAPEAIESVFGWGSVRITNAHVQNRWREILREDAGNRVLRDCAAGAVDCDNPRVKQLQRAVGEIAKLPLEQKVEAVNRIVNTSFRYTSDARVYGVRDHWATLAEFVANGAGDCEDYAIAKMWLLEAVGVPRSNLRLVVLRDVMARVDHAVLVVTVGAHNLVLDNRGYRVRADRELEHYQPIYSLSGEGTAWVHSAPPAIPPAVRQARLGEDAMAAARR